VAEKREWRLELKKGRPKLGKRHSGKKSAKKRTEGDESKSL